MAEAIESMSQSELRAEVARKRGSEQRARAEAKASGMQLMEKGVATMSAVAVGAAHAYKPELATALGGAGYLNPALVVIGLGLFAATKGMSKEAGSGMLMAGGVPLLNMLGAKLVELTSG